jgi:hypothetical protein
MSILVLTSDTLIGTPATGNLEYNGQFFGTDSNASRAQLQRIVQETAQTTTSGTSKDFTGIPAWVKRITVMFAGVSTNGTNYYMLQVGSSSVSTSGYNGVCSQLNTSNMSTGVVTNGFMLTYATTTAATTYSGNIVITLVGSNTWTQTGSLGRSDGALYTSSGISPALGGVLDRVRITTNGGTDTFDAGSVNIIYEG